MGDNIIKNSDEKIILRKCDCGGKLKSIEKTAEFIKFFYRYKFFCENCKKTLIIPDLISIIINILIFLMAISIIVIATINSYWSWILSLFHSSILMASIGVITSFIIVLFAIGGIVNLKTSIEGIKNNIKYPIIEGQKTIIHILKFVLVLLYGLVPWIILFTIGYLNSMYFHLDRENGFFLIIPGFVPIFLSKKIGISFQAAFFATAIYPVIGLIIMFFD